MRSHIFSLARLFLTAAALATPLGAYAADAAGSAPSTDRGRKSTFELTLTPQATTQPALAHPLLPPLEEIAPGNAALNYANAIVLFGNRATLDGQDYGDALQEPLSTFDPAKYAPILSGMWRSQLRLGAYEDHVAWPDDVRREGPHTILPLLGPMRTMARALALHARAALKEQRIGEALDDLRIGYALARDVGHGESLIAALIGNSMAGYMDQQLRTALEQPETPNLYWSIVQLPRPLIDPRRAVAYDRALLYFTSPEIQAAERGRYYRGQWKRMMRRLRASGSIHEQPSNEVVAALGAAAAFPEAKRYLVSHGFNAAEVDAMSVDEVLMRYTLLSYRSAADELYKIFGLPTYQAIPLAQKFDHDRAEHPSAFGLATSLPSLARLPVIFGRQDEQLAMLQIVEALRDHAARHGDALPDRLDDLALPVPLDPLTNQPFSYKRDGTTATISGAAIVPEAAQVMIVHLRTREK